MTATTELYFWYAYSVIKGIGSGLQKQFFTNSRSNLFHLQAEEKISVCRLVWFFGFCLFGSFVLALFKLKEKKKEKKEKKKKGK